MITTRKQRRQNMKRLAVGSAIAGVFGYLAGILTAPQSGKETRRDLKDNASRGLAEAEKDLKKLHTELDKSVDRAKVRGGQLRGRAKDELNDLTNRANDSKEKVREVLSAIK
jgi:gas vesicle protein